VLEVIILYYTFMSVIRQYKTVADNMKTTRKTATNENVGFKQIREVKPSRKIYSRVQRYVSIEQENGRDLKISEAAVELIEAGLEKKGIN
jgi:hypothetical protein